MPEQRQRILITGGTGLLGLNWAAAMRETHEVWLGTHRRSVHLAGAFSVPLDLKDPVRLGRQIEDLRPDIVVHAAALTDVDACEREPDAATTLNATYAENVAACTRNVGAKLIQVSTDHGVGSRSTMAREEDPMSPLNAYARSKLEGERRVMSACPTALVLRTNFFGWGHALRRSFSDWILDALRAGRSLTLFTDVYFTPIHAGRLARTAHLLLAKGASGVIHATGDERLSKHAFGMRLAALFDLPSHLIRTGESQDIRQAAPRPRDLSLSNARARALLGEGLGDALAQLNQLRQEEGAGLPAEFMHAVRESAG